MTAHDSGLDDHGKATDMYLLLADDKEVPPPVKTSYRADIDGLRALAVIPVIIFHAYPDEFPGGFVGVDIFFVISGYLISGILFKEFKKDKFTYSDFYARRVRRIFPTLILVLSTTLWMGYLYLMAPKLKALAATMLAGTLFCANLQVLSLQHSYFDIDIKTNPLLHLWSLGVEEQFYIFWPFFVSIIVKMSYHRGVVLQLAVLFLSFFINISFLGVHDSNKISFYMPLSRFWQMSMGGLLAYITMYHDASAIGAGVFLEISKFVGSFRDNYRCNMLSTFGVMLIIAGFASINESRMFPGFWAILPTLGATSIIAAGPQAFINVNILSNEVANYVGKISYCLYLWHWPLLVFAKELYPIPEARPFFMAPYSMIFVSFVLSVITYNEIEKPVRWCKSKFVLPMLVICMTVLAILAGCAYKNPSDFSMIEIGLRSSATDDDSPAPYDYDEKTFKVDANPISAQAPASWASNTDAPNTAPDIYQTNVSKYNGDSSVNTSKSDTNVDGSPLNRDESTPSNHFPHQTPIRDSSQSREESKSSTIETAFPQQHHSSWQPHQVIPQLTTLSPHLDANNNVEESSEISVSKNEEDPDFDIDEDDESMDDNNEMPDIYWQIEEAITITPTPQWSAPVTHTPTAYSVSHFARTTLPGEEWQTPKENKPTSTTQPPMLEDSPTIKSVPKESKIPSKPHLPPNSPASTTMTSKTPSPTSTATMVPSPPEASATTTSLPDTIITTLSTAEPPSKSPSPTELQSKTAISTASPTEVTQNNEESLSPARTKSRTHDNISVENDSDVVQVEARTSGSFGSTTIDEPTGNVQPTIGANPTTIPVPAKEVPLKIITPKPSKVPTITVAAKVLSPLPTNPTIEQEHKVDIVSTATAEVVSTTTPKATESVPTTAAPTAPSTQPAQTKGSTVTTTMSMVLHSTTDMDWDKGAGDNCPDSSPYLVKAKLSTPFPFAGDRNSPYYPEKCLILNPNNEKNGLLIVLGDSHADMTKPRFAVLHEAAVKENKPFPTILFKTRFGRAILPCRPEFFENFEMVKAVKPQAVLLVVHFMQYLNPGAPEDRPKVSPPQCCQYEFQKCKEQNMADVHDILSQFQTHIRELVSMGIKVYIVDQGPETYWQNPDTWINGGKVVVPKSVSRAQFAQEYKWLYDPLHAAVTGANATLIDYVDNYSDGDKCLLTNPDGWPVMAYMNHLSVHTARKYLTIVDQVVDAARI